MGTEHRIFFSICFFYSVIKRLDPIQSKKLHVVCTEIIYFQYNKKAPVSYHGNCLESVIILNLLIEVYWMDVDPLQPSS